MRLNRRFVNLGLAANLMAPTFSRVARAAGETIKIGMVLSVTGPGAETGKDALAPCSPSPSSPCSRTSSPS